MCSKPPKIITVIPVIAFFQKIYEHETAEAQNSYLTNFITSYKPVPRGERKNPSRARLGSQYCIRKSNGELVIVCQKTFESITQMSKYAARSVLNESKLRTLHSPMIT